MSSLSWVLALRFVLSPISSFSYVSKLAFAGLIVSTGVLLLVLSVVNGFDRELRDRVLAVNPHFVVSLPGGIAPADTRVDAETLAANGIQHLVPVVHATVVLAANKKLATAQLKGVNPQDYSRVSNVGSFLTVDALGAGPAAGTLAILEQQRFAIALGQSIAKRLGVSVGDLSLIHI